MLPTRLALAAVLALGTVSAQAADPTASLDRSFVEYTGNGPIGNNNLASNDFYWMFESSGMYDGQAVNSWFLIWEPVRARVSGSVTFDAPILYMFDDQAEMIATAGFGKPGVTYDYSHPNMGLDVVDKTATSFAGPTLTLAWNGSDPGDHVRILTAVPEPQTYALMLAGLGLTAWYARRRRAS
ncbi:MAG: PEP-CTERM sorting domain-containing protein [Burkholderiaceae bacterium]|nr:PEP-CTERM sorting domain-containing protein [Burkholderiaceae bacterium]